MPRPRNFRNPFNRSLHRAIDALIERIQKEGREREAGRPASHNGVSARISGYADLRGRQDVFPRHKIEDIADYLEATPLERNWLLACAGYTPHYRPLEGERLQHALHVAEDVMSHSPSPAFLMMRDWSIRGWNEFATKLLQLDFDTLHKDDRFPREKWHVLQILFDKNIPVYTPFHPNNPFWEHVARLNIWGFKYSNALCTNEEWYQKLVKDLKEQKLPRFEKMWEETEVDVEPPLEAFEPRHLPTYSTQIESHGMTIRVLGVHTSLGNFGFPMITSYIPYGVEDRVKFRELGLPVPGGTWATSRVFIDPDIERV